MDHGMQRLSDVFSFLFAQQNTYTYIYQNAQVDVIMQYTCNLCGKALKASELEPVGKEFYPDMMMPIDSPSSHQSGPLLGHNGVHDIATPT